MRFGIPEGPIKYKIHKSTVKSYLLNIKHIPDSSVKQIIWNKNPYEVKTDLYNAWIWLSICFQYGIARIVNNYGMDPRFVVIFRKDNCYNITENIVSGDLNSFERALEWTANHHHSPVADNTEVTVEAKKRDLLYLPTFIPKVPEIPPDSYLMHKDVTKTGNTRLNIFGHSMTLILGWMSAEGWKSKEAKTCLIRLGIHLSPTTIKNRMSRYRQLFKKENKVCWVVPNLTEEQINSLYKLLE